jgi:hypothetical protein
VLLAALGIIAWWRLLRHVPDAAVTRRPTAAAGASATPPGASARAGATADANETVDAAGRTPAAPPLARTLDRAYAALNGAARPCVAHLAVDANPKQQTRHHVRVDHGRVTSVARVDGDMAPGLVDCIEERWRAARWDDSDQPRPVTIELVTTLEQLRRGR